MEALKLSNLVKSMRIVHDMSVEDMLITEAAFFVATEANHKMTIDYCFEEELSNAISKTIDLLAECTDKMDAFNLAEIYRILGEAEVLPKIKIEIE